jgi:hypothetical protein
MRHLYRGFSLLFILFFLSNCHSESPVDPEDKFEWELIGEPLGDTNIYTISVHPEDEALWFVTSGGGIYSLKIDPP